MTRKLGRENERNVSVRQGDVNGSIKNLQDREKDGEKHHPGDTIAQPVPFEVFPKFGPESSRLAGFGTNMSLFVFHCAFNLGIVTFI